MRIRKTGIYILTAILMAAALLCVLLFPREKAPFSFRLETQSGRETIRFWENENGEKLVFLPGWGSLDRLYLDAPGAVAFDGTLLADGMDCGALEPDRAYSLEDGTTITFLLSQDLPALYIDTASGSMDYIHESKAHQEPGAARLYDPDGALDSRGNLEKISGHGNSTFIGSEKKPYSIQFNVDTDLLNMGAAKKWVLLANCYDPSHMKNKLVLDFAAQMGLSYTPESRWVDLYLNGDYAGLYLLAERNEVHRQRVDLPNGRGFLVSKDKQDRMEAQDIRHIVTDGGVPLRIHGSSMSDAAMTEILQSADSAILAPDGIDPRTGKHWSELIDLDSWARKYLVEEIFGGGDAGHYSQYFYYDGNKLYAGPAWDYDITMGIDVRQEIVPNIFYAHRAHMSPWFHALYGDEIFYNRVTELYREEFSPALKRLVEEQIPAYEKFLERPAFLNRLRWGTDSAGETARMQQYMRGRMEFLSDVWIEGRPAAEVTVVPEGETPTYALVYALLNGQPLPEFESWQDQDWYTGDGTPFDLGTSVSGDLAVYGRFRAAPQPETGEAPGAESQINWGLWLPLGTITLAFLIMLGTEIFRMTRRDRKSYAKKHKVSP